MTTTKHNATEVARALYPELTLIGVTPEAGYALFREKQGEISRSIGNGWYGLFREKRAFCAECQAHTVVGHDDAGDYCTRCVVSNTLEHDDVGRFN